MKTKFLPNEQFIPYVKSLLDEGHTVTFRVRGNSMRPFLESERDKVVLAPPTEEVKTGDVVLALTIDNRYVLHRVVKKYDDRLVLFGDGNVKYVEVCRPEDVIGIAVGFWRKRERYTDLKKSRAWRIYSKIWTKTGWTKRFLLAFYRLVWLKIFPVKINNDED